MKYLQAAWQVIDGYKTYIVAVCGVVWGLYTKNTDTVLASLALLGLRSAMKKLE